MTNISQLELQTKPPTAIKESVWDYPEVPHVAAVSEKIKVIFNGVTIAESKKGKRVLQKGVPPSFYFPPEDVCLANLHKTEHRSYGDEKKFAEYWTVKVAERSAKNAAWSYPDSPEHLTPKGYFAFYAHLLDACFIGHEQVKAPIYSWLGGWVTRNIEGPFITKERCSQRYLTNQAKS